MILYLIALFIPLAMGALNTSSPRGEEVIKIPVPNSSQAEICVIPKKYPQGSYSDKDLRSEQELCAMVGLQPVAVCPKMVSTNPAIEFFSIPDGMTAAQVESTMCTHGDSKKLAKYKSSISCSYTPSILAYYHISRILGNVVQVPPVVVRTMNLDNHRALAAKAIKKVDPAKSLLVQVWRGFGKHLNSGAVSSKKDHLFTSDFEQSYGALQVNPRKEEKYSEMFFSARGNETRADAFRMRSPVYALLKDRRDLRSFIGNQWSTGNIQKVLQMQNVSDMIILDHLLNQQDRFGNVHFTTAFYYMDNSEGGNKVRRKNKMNEAEIRSTGAVAVKDMMLKDNDCGVIKENLGKKARLLYGISHLSPSTYERLLRLHSEVGQGSARSFFKNEILMTENDYALFQTNLNEVVQTLQSACREGRLKLDLDLEGHFANKPLNQSCG